MERNRKLIYAVKWKELWRSLTKYMTLTIISSVVVILAIRFSKEGFSYDVIFKHLSPVGYIGLFAGMFVFSFVCAGAISLLFKLTSITIEDDCIAGRNYFGLKKKIPLSKIEELRPFSNNGIKALIADGGKYGSVYIYMHTERLNELIELIESKMGK